MNNFPYLRIREMLVSDLVHVMPLIRSFFQEQKKDMGGREYPYEVQGDDEALYNWLLLLLRTPTKGCFVAIPEGRVVKGFILGEMQFRSIGAPKKVATGMYLYVDPRVRGQGLGELLVKRFCDWAWANEAEAIEAIYVPGTRAHAMWARSGFKTFTATGAFVDDNWKAIKGGYPWAVRKAEVAVEENLELAFPPGAGHSGNGSQEEKMPETSTPHRLPFPVRQ